MEMACWENCGETIPFFYLPFFLFLNAVGQGTKYISQKTKALTLTLWWWPVWLRPSQLTSVGLSFFCKIKRKGLFTLVVPKYSARTPASTWPGAPGRRGGEKGLSPRRHGSFQVTPKLLFCWPKEFLCKKHFKWV